MVWSIRSLVGIRSYFGGNNVEGVVGRRGTGKRRAWFEYLEERQMMSDTAPVVSPVAEGVVGNTVTAFTATKFTGSFSDADVGNTLQMVAIDSLPANGTLTLGGAAVAVSEQIPVAQLANLTYTPNAGFSGSDSFHWNGSDGTLYATTDSVVNLTVSPPSLTLTGNGTLVVNTATTSGASNFTYYGGMSTTNDAADLGTATRTYVLTNNSNATINLTGGVAGLVQITGTNAGDFTVTAEPVSSLAAGASTTFTVTFAPTAAGTRNAMITIPNSSGDLGGYDFAISGLGEVTTNDPTTHLEVGTTKAGIGNATAVNGDVLVISYTGYLTNGKIFDSTAIEGGTPLTFRLDNTTGRVFLANDQVGPPSVDQNVIDGWETGLQGIKQGENRTLIIPSSMGYGANGTTGVPGNATLIFDVTVVDMAYSPELGVRGNGVSIANGAITTNTTDGTNFGSLTLGQTQLMHSFSLLDFSEQTNSNGTLVTGISVSSITLTGANSGDFVLSLGTGSVLNVTFKPTNQGLRTAVVNVFSNDPNAPDFTFTVQGTVPPVDLTATLGNVKYPPAGLVSGGGGIVLPVVVHNSGFGTVSGSNTTTDITIVAQNIANPSNNPPILLQVNENFKGLGSGRTKTFNLNVVPTGLADGTYVFTVEVNSNQTLSEGNLANDDVSTANITIAAGFNNISGSLVSTTMPAAVVSGAAINGTLTVSVKNAGNLNLPKGQQATIAVIAHNTGTGANTTLYTSPAESISALAAGTSKPIKLTLKNAAGLVAGNYTYEALITPVQALAESSTGDNLITTTAANGTLGVTSASAFVDLTGTLGTSSLVSSATGVKGKLSLTVKNIGNAVLPAAQTIQLQIIAHPAGEGDVLGDVTLQTSPVLSVKKWKAGQTGSFSVTVADVNALAGGTYDIEAKIVPVVALAESDTGNNLVTVNGSGQAVTLVSANP